MLTSEETKALKKYSGSFHRPLNDCLRGIEPCDQETQRITGLLDAAIKKSVVPSSLTLFRGVDDDGARRIFSIGLRVGLEIRDEGFMSCSTDLATARLFSAGAPPGIVLQIRVPKGGKALDLSPYSRYPAEQEVVLPRGTALRVIGFDASSGIIETEVI